MRRVAAAVIAACELLGAGCGDSTPRAANPQNAQRDPAWQDALDVTPDLVVVLHPHALQRDAVYGPVIRQISQAAAARSAAVAAMRALEAFEASEEVIVAMTNDGAALVVLRGVRADLDPARLVDSSGATLWTPAQGASRVPELTRDQAGVPASLFVLPQRTWVVAVGNARARAREAFAHPVGRPAWSYDRDALASIRILGPALVEHVPKLRYSGQLSVVGHKLTTATFSLSSGKEGTMTVALAYGDEDAAAEAEVTIRHVIDVLRRSEDSRFRWLQPAVVARDEARIVTLRAPLPKVLLDDFAHARGVGEIDVPSP